MLSDSTNGIFPFGQIEQISEVGLVEKIDKKYVKDSIDRLVGYVTNDSMDEQILLCEMKARVVSTTAQ